MKEPLKVTEIPARPKEKKLLRVAAYARVSTEKDSAFRSLETQMDYYRKYVAKEPGWELAGVFSDNGISGTLDSRPAFREMLKACRDGKVDMIITKAVSRFARNVVTLLETMRELKSIGIDIYFESENIHSLSSEGETLMTLLAWYAEEEARSASENVKWKVRKKFEKGELWTTNLVGYRLVDGRLEVVPEEAETVRQIFVDYLSGMGVGRISKKLLDAGIKTRYVSNWSTAAISRMLSNVKYTGDVLLQKYYTPDFRTKEYRENRGNVPQYYASGTHEAIIDRETFEKVQREKERRREKNPRFKNSGGKHTFTGLIVCGNCGRRFMYRTYKYKGMVNAFWQCNGSIVRGKAYCPSPSIPESVLLEKASDVTGVPDVTRGSLAERLERIEVPGPDSIRFCFRDGTSKDVHWEKQQGKKHRKED